ncbi:MAG: hypothetical protein M3O32_07415 [Actinomycetota bacterium]|nr:hypothetical protein [Actinomycetota bacterium]
MSLAPRLLATIAVAVGTVSAVSWASPGTAEPNIDGRSAVTVIEQLRDKGYTVEVNGSPAGDISLLTTCTVTSIAKAVAPQPESMLTETVNVVVACPISHA